MDNTLTDWVKLFVLMVLVVMALFTIPMHGPEHKTPVSEQQPRHELLVPVSREITNNHPQTSFRYFQKQASTPNAANSPASPELSIQKQPSFVPAVLSWVTPK